MLWRQQTVHIQLPFCVVKNVICIITEISIFFTRYIHIFVLDPSDFEEVIFNGRSLCFCLCFFKFFLITLTFYERVRDCETRLRVFIKNPIYFWRSWFLVGCVLLVFFKNCFSLCLFFFFAYKIIFFKQKENLHEMEIFYSSWWEWTEQNTWGFFYIIKFGLFTKHVASIRVLIYFCWIRTWFQHLFSSPHLSCSPLDRGSIDEDFATSFLHSLRSSAFWSRFFHSRPDHSLMLSSHRFLSASSSPSLCCSL